MVSARTLTGDGAALIRGANTSVVCATYNLQPTSALWAALVDLRQRRPGVAVRLYVDAQTAFRFFSASCRLISSSNSDRVSSCASQLR